MEKEEILEKAKSKKAIVSEFEKEKINKGNWISIIVAGVVGVIFAIIEGIRGNASAIYAIAIIMEAWACSLYFCQYFIAKRKRVGILIGAILYLIAVVIFTTIYVLICVGVM